MLVISSFLRLHQFQDDDEQGVRRRNHYRCALLFHPSMSGQDGRIKQPVSLRIEVLVELLMGGSLIAPTWRVLALPGLP
jgi:hypothetical protein